MFVGEVMADRGVDLSALPKEVRDQLAELDLELSEGKGGEGADGLIGRRDAVAYLEPLLNSEFHPVVLL